MGELLQSLGTRHHREQEGGLRRAQLEGSDFGLERVLGDGQDANECVVLRNRELVSSSYFQGQQIASYCSPLWRIRHQYAADCIILLASVENPSPICSRMYHTARLCGESVTNMQQIVSHCLPLWRICHQYAADCITLLASVENPSPICSRLYHTACLCGESVTNMQQIVSHCWKPSLVCFDKVGLKETKRMLSCGM